MNIKRFVLAIIFTFVFVNIYEWFVHGILLQGAYEETSHLWRTFDEMKELFSWTIFTQVFFVIMLAWIFTRHYESKGLGEGMRFGLYIGLLMGSVQFSSYVYMPISVALTLAWSISIVVECIGAGIVLALVYRN